MNQETHLSINPTIQKLTNLLEVKYIYKSEVEYNEEYKTLLIIILKGNSATLSLDLSSMVAKIFEDATAYHYRIFSHDYAQQQLINNNLFFVYSCTWHQCIYQEEATEIDNFYNYQVSTNTLSILQANFDTEQHKIAAFKEGAHFFVEQSNLAQAAFMLHQSMELWYRYAGLMIMGKERKSHSIKELQTYLKALAPALSNLFNTEVEEEQHLLKLLDDAYITTRYANNYHINLSQIHHIQEKAQNLQNIITQQFHAKLLSCAQRANQPQSKVPTAPSEHEAHTISPNKAYTMSIEINIHTVVKVGMAQETKYLNSNNQILKTSNT